MNIWTTRARQRMKELKITHKVVAECLRVSRASVTHFLSGRREPSLDQLVELATILKTTPAWLQFGIDAPGNFDSNASNVKPIAPLSSYLPVIPWSDAGQWQKLAKDYQSTESEWIPYAGDPIPDAFALRIKGDSMAALQGTSFIENTYVIVAPHRVPKDQDFVVVQLKNTKEALLRQLAFEGNQRLLKPLNPRYLVMKMKAGVTICGVVCQSLQKF
jgi:SOS-response transcriptional repressor LexA